MDNIGWITPAILTVLIMLSAYFSASETAISSVNKIRLKNMADDGDRQAKAALALAESFDRTLSAILIGNNVVNIAAASTATLIASTAFGASGAAASTIVMTIVILVFGEIIPKTYAKENSERVALATAATLGLVIRLLYPLVLLFMKLQEQLNKTYGTKGFHPLVTEQELVTIIETIEEEGVIDGQKSELVQSALSFDETTVQEVLTPRVDIAAVDIDDSPEEIKEIILGERFSRIPVYRKNLDNIVGILQTRDYLEVCVEGKAQIDLEGLLTKPLFVHKSKRLSAMLTEFQHTRSHMAVVTDDYGGTMGIVTMEDLLEELVGEIWDEDEEAQHDFLKTGSYTYEVSGDYSIYETFDKIGFDYRDFSSEYSSTGGWVLERFGRIPSENEGFEYQGIQVTVKEMDDQRVKKLLISYIPEEFNQ